jgi:hypothetical protein
MLADSHFMAKDQTLIVGSPFKFGFFAGMGFFVASLLMSVITFVLIGVVGIGTLLGSLRVHPQNQQSLPTPAMAVAGDGQR